MRKDPRIVRITDDKPITCSTRRLGAVRGAYVAFRASTGEVFKDLNPGGSIGREATDHEKKAAVDA